MAEITGEPHYNTLSTIVRNLEQKNTLHITPTGKPINTIHHCYRDYRKGFMNMAIDNYFNSSYKKHGFVFAKEENINKGFMKFSP
jgi:hypothetical protein